MNIEASIVPGESAAGIQLGSRIEEILKEQETRFFHEEYIYECSNSLSLSRLGATKKASPFLAFAGGERWPPGIGMLRQSCVNGTFHRDTFLVPS